MLSVPSAIVCCSLCSGLYVGLLYIWPLLGVHSDVLNPKTRDRTDVIKLRSISVIIASIISYLIVHCATGHRVKSLELFAHFSTSLYSAAVGLTLTLTLMMGPLLYGESAMNGLNKWLILRALLIAPVTEEFVFRGCCDALLREASLSFPWRLALCGPVFFTLAHVHHYTKEILVDPVRGVISACLTMSYTGVFGAFCTALLEATGSLAGPIASHMVCNYTGLPDFDFRSDGGRKAVAYIAGGLLFLTECVYFGLLHYARSVVFQYGRCTLPSHSLNVKRLAD
ncbi:CAAX prenyl protease [Perkinsus olseni]|uniref:intramembrane prenyl-peptidase Rce1 n=1 Tax=Perkinsus olseni TaxID=32597 RepID=A0A7J6QY24_PEROL|nr:CAAX prenyl protease [Perkinsus olseni]KAF4736682.1 CAAX prenyl protease [Perkinsus olseni]